MIIKAIVLNLLLMVIYCALVVANALPADRGFSIAIIGGILMALQVGLNLIVSLVLLAMGRRELAMALLISGGVLAPVGFCTWLILLSIYG